MYLLELTMSCDFVSQYVWNNIDTNGKFISKKKMFDAIRHKFRKNEKHTDVNVHIFYVYCRNKNMETH